MSLQPITPTPQAWDAFVESHPRAHLLQTSAWGDLKAAYGWVPGRIALAGSDGTLVAGVQFLMRQFPYKIGWLGYAPYGPLVDWSDDALVQTLLKATDRAVKKHHGGFLKIEPGFDQRGVDFAAYGFYPSPQTVQPPRTIQIDLTASEDEILARMNQGTRRNIRKSEKYEITVQPRASFVEEHSDVEGDRYVFAYTITLTNTGTVAAQLISRHWIITDGHGREQEVRGEGVVEGRDVVLTTPDARAHPVLASTKCQPRSRPVHSIGTLVPVAPRAIDRLAPTGHRPANDGPPTAAGGGRIEGYAPA
jgi:hypothetical protein